ncbi:MAG TPA: phytanoyl-CoA dioxygenase family protein [Candidatus Binataceae bacterium]|nr:phytanoyl-CoA dioxygenase family protein [Candidatus Binataceae bacterium]
MTATVDNNCAQLPKLTDDLAVAKRDLDQFGYCLIANALTAAEVKAVRERLLEQAAAEREQGLAYYDGAELTSETLQEIARGRIFPRQTGPNQRVWNLVNKGRVFRDLVVHPNALNLMPHLLGDDFILSSLTANIAAPGGALMLIHRDQGYLPAHHLFPAVANVGWMLDDVTDLNGGTRLIPGSHLWEHAPRDRLTLEGTVAAQGPAGSALVFEGRTFHGTGPNRSKGKRHLLLSYYARPFLRQQENVFMSLDRRVEAGLSDEMRIRLGYRVWKTLGGVQGPNGDAITSRPDAPVGELRPQSALSE